jgi:hypothetical protein
MSLFQYKNTADIFRSTKPTNGSFFAKNQARLLSPTFVYPNLNIETFTAKGSAYSAQKVEFHVYSMDGKYIAGSQYSGNSQVVDNETIIFDLEADLADIGIRTGVYRFTYNILHDRVGSFATEKLFIFDVSPSRTELILKLEAPDDSESLRSLASFFRYWASQRVYFINSVLNFGQNRLVPIANVNTDNVQNKIYIKLFEPLPPEFSIQSSCWISEVLSSPYIDSTEIVPAEVSLPTNTLQEPQTDIEKLYWRHLETDYKTWTDIVSSNSDIKDLTINNLFRKKYGIKLNIDFSDFKNFINFSSLEERILNFTYKVELISWYQDQINAIYNLNSNHNSDILLYVNSKNAILQSFDEFELFLYYDRDSIKRNDITYPIPPVPKFTRVTDLTPIRWIEWAQTWVNANVIWSIGPGIPTGFEIVDIGSDAYQGWKQAAIETAKEFDLTNEAQLIRTIPDFIRDDENNSEYLLFVNMIAHYFDTIWLYIKHFNDRYAQDEHPDFGISKDLLVHMANNYGWKLNESQKLKDLWFYFFGFDEQQKLTRSNITDNSFAPSSSDYTKSIWKRILLNLPKILKSKGTDRSVKALLSVYGIPASQFFIREFGGAGNQDIRPKHKEEKLIRYIDLDLDEYIEFPYLQFSDYNNNLSYPNSIYFRFLFEPSTIANSVVFSKNEKIKVEFEKSGSDQYTGNINLSISSSAGILSSSIQNVQYIDELPSVIFLQTDRIVSQSAQSASLDLFFLQKKYDKINIFESTSINIYGAFTNALLSNDTITLCNDVSAKYYVNEFRYWKYPIDTEIMKSHALSPLSYHGSNVSQSTYDLVARYPVWLENAYTTDTIKPITIGNINQSSSYEARVILSKDTGSVVAYSEFSRFEIPTIAQNAIIPEKERIESSTLIGNLSYNTRAELSAYDFKPNDENKIKIGFSPQFNINEDIFNRFGTFELDEYIGSTIDSNSKYYSKLLDLANLYFKESQTTDDIVNYLKALKIYDFTIFEQIKQIVPAKANAIIGLIVENNELQRIKLKQLPMMSATFDQSNLVEFIKQAKRTATVSGYNGTVRPETVLNIDAITPPVGIIEHPSSIKNTFVVLSGSLSPANNLVSVLSSKPEYNSTINIFPFIANNAKDKKTKINNFVRSVTNIEASMSYSTPVLGKQLGYENLDFYEPINIDYSIDETANNFYYADIEYKFNSDASASINNFSEASLVFGKNPFFIKRLHKGAENHRYVGSKVTAFDVNYINLNNPGQSLVTAVTVIQSGSVSVNFSSSLNNQNYNIFIDNNTIPPGV